MPETSFSNELPQDPVSGTVDEPTVNAARAQDNNPLSEAAFSIDPMAVESAEPMRTTDFSPEPHECAELNPPAPMQTTDFNAQSHQPHRAPSTASPRGTLDADRSASRRAADLPETVADYEILGVLGRGAMGVVYKARQPGLKRLVALKMILSGAHAHERELARFRSEAEAVAQLQHPNIVQIYEVGEDNGQPFFSLEYIEGVSLARKCNGAPLPPREAAELLLQLAHGIDYAHQKGIIHRDLKPANVLLATDGLAKITDFGLAKKLQEDSGQTRAGTVLGTPSYMPPEQASGRIHDIGPHSDVYSLGAVLYDLLTGRPPFRGTTMLDTLQMVQMREPVTPAELQPKMPRDLQTICLKCLQKEPSRRYESAGALAEDLRRFLTGEPILARPAGVGERLWRWCRRNPLLAGLSAALVLLLVIWAATSSILYLIATRNEGIAQENEQRKIEEAARADAKAAEAVRNADTALAKQQNAFRMMVNLGSEMQKRLRSRRLSGQLGPQARTMQQQLMDVLRRKMLEFAGDTELRGIHSFGTALLHQQIGDLMLRLGEGKEALRQFEEGYRIVKQAADEQPDSDKARANLGHMLMRLGDVALEANGEAALARDYYQRGWNLQHEVSTRPRGSDFPAEQSAIVLSHHAVHLGRALLALGHPAEASKQFEQALKLRRQWAESVANRPEANSSRSYLVEAYMGLGTAAWHCEDAKAFEQSFHEALQIGEALVKERPRFVDYKNDLAEVYAAQGEGQARLGRYDDARTSYQRAWENLEIVMSHNSEDYSPLPLLARLHEQLGADAQRRGQRTEAQTHYREASQIRQDFVQLEPENPVGRAAYLLALAHCGRYAEAAKGAEALRPKAAKSPGLLLQLARCYSVCSAQAGQEQVCVSKALEALRALIALDYRDPVLVRTDADLAPLRKEAAFRALLPK